MNRLDYRFVRFPKRDVFDEIDKLFASHLICRVQRETEKGMFHSIEYLRDNLGGNYEVSRSE